MRAYTILKEPHPLLRRVADPIEIVDDAVRALFDAMLIIMRDADGIGLAAPQIGVSKRLLVMEVPHDPSASPGAPSSALNAEDGAPGEAILYIANPEIVENSPEDSVCEEGCLSVPKVYEKVVRPSWVRVRYRDYADRVCEQVFYGLQATCVQHEIDHLDGILFIDRAKKKSTRSRK